MAETTIALIENNLRIVNPSLAHHLPTDTRHCPPNLAAVIDAWPTLPEPIRAGILAMAKAARTPEGALPRRLESLTRPIVSVMMLALSHPSGVGPCPIGSSRTRF
jgi:hypothetical protein